MEMYIGGKWVNGSKMNPVTSPFSGQVVDAVPDATTSQVENALSAAETGATEMARLTAAERSQILNRAADMIASRIEELAQTITSEVGKPITESRGEVSRMPDLLRLCAFEGSQARGETLPLDAQIGARGKLGMTLRVPCGIVVAITPFNYPLLLVVHKIGPALAAGNAVILKPANATPLTALKLTKILLDAGLPPNGLQCVTGSGKRIGPLLCADPRVRKITFTGSTDVGEQISRVAGVKRLSLELGSNCPLVIMPDADMEAVAQATSLGGFVNAGQVCISTQRILVHRQVYAHFLDALKPVIENIPVGDPLKEDTRLSAMISASEAERVGSWISEAVNGGARVVTGGQREGAVFGATVLADVTPEMRVFRDELFGPAVAVTSIEDIAEAVTLANDSRYGLGAGIFTNDLNTAFRFVREVHSGNVMVNWTPLWRADLMPYGGVKQSGIGKEGPRYEVEEMTDSKTVVFHGLEA